MECVAAYLTESEKKRLEKSAKSAGMSMSCYIKSRLFDCTRDGMPIYPVDREKALAERYYNTKTLSEKINLSPSAIKRLCKSNKLPFYKIGTEYRFKESDVNEFLQRSRNGSFANQDSEYLTISDCAEKLSVTYDTVSKYLKAEKLKGSKINGRNWRIRKEDFEDFVNRSQ